MRVQCRQKPRTIVKTALKILGLGGAYSERGERKESALAEKRVKLLQAFPIPAHEVFHHLCPASSPLLPFLGFFT